MVRGVILLINMGKMGADNSLLYKLWENNYKGIGNCNLALDEVATSPVITEEKGYSLLGSYVLYVHSCILIWCNSLGEFH